MGIRYRICETACAIMWPRWLNMLSVQGARLPSTPSSPPAPPLRPIPFRHSTLTLVPFLPFSPLRPTPTRLPLPALVDPKTVFPTVAQLTLLPSPPLPPRNQPMSILHLIASLPLSFLSRPRCYPLLLRIQPMLLHLIIYPHSPPPPLFLSPTGNEHDNRFRYGRRS